MTDAPLHPEVDALVIGTPTCRHGNFTEQDLRRIALLAAAKAREEERERIETACDALFSDCGSPSWNNAIDAFFDAIRRGTP